MSTIDGLRSPRRFDPTLATCDDDRCDRVLMPNDVANALVDLKLEADDAARRGDRARAEQLRAEFQRRKADAVNAARAAAINATDNAQQKGHLAMIDKELQAAAESLGVKADGHDNRSLAFAVLSACGVNPKGPRAGDRTDTIDAMPDAYVIARAVSAAEYARRERADAARADSFATVKRSDAPACGCGGSSGKNDAISTERAARERMMQAGRLAHASPERIDEVSAIDAYDHKRATARANMRPAPSRADAGDREARAKAAMNEHSRNAWRMPSTDDEGTV